jgi:ribosomal protein L34E
MRPIVIEPNDGLTYQQRFFRDMRAFCKTPGGKLILKFRKFYKRKTRAWKNSQK